MSVPSQTPYNIYTANGLTTVFAYQFMIMAAGDLDVSVNGTSIASGFTVQGAGQTGGGQVVFTEPPANGDTVMLLRKLTIKRDTDYQDNGDLLAETINADFDRLWLAMQQAFLSDSLSLKRPLLGGPYNAGGLKIINLQDPTNPQDAATKDWVDQQYSVPTSEAKQAAAEAKEARDESREIADKFGDVDGAVTAAGNSAAAAASSADSAAASADRAESVADVYGTYPDTSTGLAAVAEGQYFRVPQGVSNNISFKYYRKVGGAAVEVAALPGAAAVDAKSITSGDIFSVISARGAGLNGGSSIIDAANRTIGIIVPAGSTGSSSYFCADIPAVPLRSRQVRITQVYIATAEWLNTVNVNELHAQSRKGTVVSTLSVTDYVITQYGNTITQSGTVTVPSDADYIGLAVQYASNAAVKSSDMSIQLTQVAYTMHAQNEALPTENDGMLELRLSPVKESVIKAQTTADSGLLTSGNVWGLNTASRGTSQVFNGAEKITDSSGGAIGLHIPANAGTGQSSYLTAWMSAAGMSGRTINIIAIYETSAAWSTNPAPNTLALQVLRGSSTVNISIGSGVTRTITQSGTTMTIALQYTVDPSDINIGICYQIAGGNAIRDYERSMQVQSISYSLLPGEGRTRNDAMLAVYVAAEIAKIDTGSKGYSVVKTVKPVGGDYTHPKLALDAITDASASKRYCIAVYPGEYTGYAEWATKDYVDIIGIGRREEIIVRYDSGDSANENTVRNTSLFWMASETLLKNITWKLKNGRYVIHMESNGARPDITMAIEDCSVIHEGNASNTYWWQPSQYGVGAGLSAGNTVRLRNSYFEGRGGGFSYHTPNNRVDYTKPITVDAEGCTFKNTRTLANTGYPYEGAFWIKPITKGAADTCRLVGNTFIGGDVYYSTGEWLDTTDTTTNRAQVQVWGHGNAGFSFYSDVPYTPNMTGINQ